MSLIHYHRDVVNLENKKYEQGSYDRWDKPDGFWVTLNKTDNWKDWCEAEEYDLEGLKIANKFKLKKGCNVLFINTEEDMHEFNCKYRFNPYKSLSISYIDWRKVAADGYQGIIISTYFWNLRLDFYFHWYYSWDCVSGCIWDTSCLIPAGYEEVEINYKEKEET